jgi:hypothetical protein
MSRCIRSCLIFRRTHSFLPTSKKGSNYSILLSRLMLLQPSMAPYSPCGPCKNGLLIRPKNLPKSRLEIGPKSSQNLHQIIPKSSPNQLKIGSFRHKMDPQNRPKIGPPRPPRPIADPGVHFSPQAVFFNRFLDKLLFLCQKSDPKVRGICNKLTCH